MKSRRYSISNFNLRLGSMWPSSGVYVVPPRAVWSLARFYAISFMGRFCHCHSSVWSPSGFWVASVKSSVWSLSGVLHGLRRGSAWSISVLWAVSVRVCCCSISVWYGICQGFRVAAIMVLCGLCQGCCVVFVGFSINLVRILCGFCLDSAWSLLGFVGFSDIFDVVSVRGSVWSPSGFRVTSVIVLCGIFQGFCVVAI